VTFHDSAADLLFTGDAAGIWSPSAGRVFPTSPPPQFDLERALADVEAMRALDPGVLCFGHFGPKSYEGAVLEEYERVLTDWVERVRATREDRDDDATVEHLAANPDPEAVEVWGKRKAAAETRLNAKGVLASLD
jgi:glyoxylase-like metal-dependent hydrolase (beta-lactamase superfamily II)